MRGGEFRWADAEFTFATVKMLLWWTLKFLKISLKRKYLQRPDQFVVWIPIKPDLLSIKTQNLLFRHGFGRAEVECS